jgi:hypothetical protein
MRWNSKDEFVEEVVDCFVIGFDEPGGEGVSSGGVAVGVAISLSI